jgi:hypothetical protein
LEATFSFWVLNYHKLVTPKIKIKNPVQFIQRIFVGEKKKKKLPNSPDFEDFFKKLPYLEISIKSQNT